MDEWEERLEQKRNENLRLDKQLWEDEMEKLRDQEPTPGRKITLREGCDLAQRNMEKLERERMEQRGECDCEPTPGLVEAAKIAADRLDDYARRDLGRQSPEEAGPTLAIADNLRSALAECGEWERVMGDNEILTFPLRSTSESVQFVRLSLDEILLIVRLAWPGAEVWRRKEK